MELTFKFTEQEAQIIINALIKEPYIEVYDTIRNLQNQASEQIEHRNTFIMGHQGSTKSDVSNVKE